MTASAVNTMTTTITGMIGGNVPDGLYVFPTTSMKGGFWGATPVVQPTATAQSAVATTAITTLATTPTATDIAVAVNSLITRVAALVTLENQIRSDLVTVGIIKGSA
jgi:hypothetical protein